MPDKKQQFLFQPVGSDTRFFTVSTVYFMETLSMHVRVTGLVQGVAFRYYTKKKADQLKLGGWVRNCGDGSVEAVVTGPTGDVETMISWFSEGSPHSVVDNVFSEPSDIPHDQGSFEITY